MSRKKKKGTHTSFDYFRRYMENGLMLGALESQILTSWVSRFELRKWALCLRFLESSFWRSADRQGTHSATEPRLQLKDKPFAASRPAGSGVEPKRREHLLIILLGQPL